MFISSKFATKEENPEVLKAIYLENLQDLLNRQFYGMSITPSMKDQVVRLIERYRADFLEQHRHSGLLAHGEVQVNFDKSMLNVISAEIITREEWLEIKAQAVLDREIAIVDAEREKMMQRRYNSLLNRRRKLHAKYKNKLTPGIASIWDTLSEIQQYVILKDISYAERHSKLDTGAIK